MCMRVRYVVASAPFPKHPSPPSCSITTASWCVVTAHCMHVIQAHLAGRVFLVNRCWRQILCYSRVMTFESQHVSCAGMNACTSVGKLTEARGLIQDMKQKNIPLDIRVFNILLKGYSRQGGISAVPGILQEMADAGLKPSAVTYNTLIDTYVRAGQLSHARQTCTDAQAAG